LLEKETSLSLYSATAAKIGNQRVVLWLKRPPRSR